MDIKEITYAFLFSSYSLYKYLRDSKITKSDSIFSSFLTTIFSANSIKLSDLKIDFKEAPLVDLETVSLVHPKKHIEQIFSNIPKEGKL